METKEKMKQLYETIISEDVLTFDVLCAHGLTISEIDNFIQNGILKKVDSDKYILQSSKGLYQYGLELNFSKQYEKAHKCFEKSFLLNRTCKAVYERILISCIDQKDYTKMVEYMDMFYQEKGTNDINNNLYLYLLSMFIDLPNRYRELAKSFQVTDFVSSDDGKTFSNILRRKIYKQKYSLAIQQLNKLMVKDTHHLILRKLLYQAQKQQFKDKNKLWAFITRKQYGQVLAQYEKMDYSHRLAEFDRYCFKLVCTLFNVTSTKEIPVKQPLYTNDSFEAIDGNNYSLALALEKDRIYRKHIENKKNVMYLILEDLNNIIYQLKNGGIKNTEIEWEVKMEVGSTEKISNNINYPFKNIEEYEYGSDEIDQLIGGKLSELYKNGIAVLPSIDNRKIHYIQNMVNSIPDVILFSIEDGECQHLVLRLKPYYEEYVDIEGLRMSATESYKNRDYKSCIEKNKLLLGFETPPSSIYAQLGLCYLNIGRKETALDFLMVATYMKGSHYDFSILIDELREQIGDKPYVEMDITEFHNGNDYYGIDTTEEFSEIVNLVQNQVGLEEACEQVGIDAESKGIVFLICARDCYSCGKYTLGDTYLRKFQVMKEKGKSAIKFCNEIQRNKKLYKHRCEKSLFLL